MPFLGESHYSLLDGLSKPKQIVERVQQLDMKACSITDHGSISGSIQFLEKAKDANIKPIIGCELYISKYNAKIKDDTNRSLSHLLVLAQNNNGWKKLIKLVSESNQPDHFYYRPRLSLEQLEKYAGDLIVITGHLGSTLSNILLEDGKMTQTSYRDGLAHVSYMRRTFGENNFFLECQLIDKDNIPEMQILTDIIRNISVDPLMASTEYNIPIKIIATPDAHYCVREQAVDQRILLARNLGCKTLEEAKDSEALFAFFKSNNFHIPPYQEMIDVGHTKEELDNTNYVASLCEEYTDILKSPQLPKFECPDGHNPDTWLRQLCRNGWREKIQNKIPKDKQQVYIDRVKEELGVLEGFKLSSYFLIVQDIIQYVINNGWLPGVARGSSAGCLVSYLIGITKVDPIKYDLLFERFINPGRMSKDRISLPDIDIDVPASVRGKVIDYIKDKYGHDKVSQMITFTTMKGRGAIKDVLRAYGNVSFTEMNEITKHIPDEAKIAGELQEMKSETGESSIIQYTIENDVKAGKMKEWCFIDKNNKDNKNELQGPLAKRFEQAIRLEGTISSQSKHAAGIVVAPVPLHEMCPLVYDSKNKDVVAGFSMDDLEAVGCLKLDVLSIAMLDKIMGICQILEKGDINEI